MRLPPHYTFINFFGSIKSYVAIGAAHRILGNLGNSFRRENKSFFPIAVLMNIGALKWQLMNL